LIARQQEDPRDLAKSPPDAAGHLRSRADGHSLPGPSVAGRVCQALSRRHTGRCSSQDHVIADLQTPRQPQVCQRLKGLDTPYTPPLRAETLSARRAGFHLFQNCQSPAFGRNQRFAAASRRLTTSGRRERCLPRLVKRGGRRGTGWGLCPQTPGIF
jgi:hypothetical protein